MEIERIIVVSTNNNPDYWFYSPYIYKAWKSYGWSVCTMITDDVDKSNIKSDYTVVVPKMEGIRQETIAQASRLYAARFFGFQPDKYLMISDMDLLPLQDYWKPDLNEITSYGHDLTWRTFIPMGYCGMTADKWKEVMELTEDSVGDFIRDCKLTGLPYSEKWEEFWNHDWTLLTKRLKDKHWDKIKFIDRGQIDIAGATLALGRVDRYNWDKTLQQPNLIDCHAENNNVRHPDKFDRFIKLFESVHGKL